MIFLVRTRHKNSNADLLPKAFRQEQPAAESRQPGPSEGAALVGRLAGNV